MDRRRILGLSAGLATLPWFRPAAAADLELLEAGTLSAATEGTFPPYSIRLPNGELDGLEMRTLAEIARRLGLAYRPVVIKWESLLVGLLADQDDMSGNAMGITAERQQQVTFCDAWVESGARLVVAQDSPIRSYDDVRGRTIGVLVASTFVPLVDRLGGVVKTYKADPDALTDLVNGNVDSVVTDSVAGAYAVKTAGLPVRMLDGFIDSYQLGWAVKQGKPNLVRAINGALGEMVKDGSFAAIAADLIGIDPTPKEPIRSQL